jgi:hypothetical protein
MAGTLVIIQPDGTKTEQRWEKSGPPNWETLSAAVGGYIERIRVKYNGRARDCYVNEEGILKRLPANSEIRQLAADYYAQGSTYSIQQFHGPGAIWVPDPIVLTR